MIQHRLVISLLFVSAFIVQPSHLCSELRVWAIGDGVRVDPVSGNVIEQMQSYYGPVVNKDYKQRNWIWNTSTATVSLKAARNEVVVCQLIIETDCKAKGVSVKASDLNGTGQSSIPASSIYLFREWYHHVPVSVKTRGVLFPLKSGWYPDALVPLDAETHGAPFDIPGEDFYSIDEEGNPNQLLASQTNQAIWLDIYVPDNTPAGNYRGNLLVTADNEPGKTVVLELEVFDFTIPDEIHTTWEFMDYGRVTHGPENLELKIWRMAQQHRVTLSSTKMDPDLVGEGYEVKFDWRNFDRRWGKYLDGSAFTDGPGKNEPVKHVLLPFDVRIWREDHNRQGWRSRDWPFGLPGDSLNQHFTPQYEKAFLKKLAEFEQHFEKQGWTKTRMLLWMDGVDEPGTNSGEVGLKPIRMLKHIGELVKSSGPRRIKHRIDIGGGLNTIVDIDGDGHIEADPQSEVISYLRDAVDIWNCHGNCLTPKLLNMRKGSPWTDVWFYNGFEPSIGCGLINGESLGFRTWQWIAWKYRVGGACDWEFGLTRGLNVFRQIDTDPRSVIMFHRTVYIYPGEQIDLEGEPLPSIRLKMIRRSLQDYEYFWLLTQKLKDGGAAADKVVEKIVDRGLREARPVGGRQPEADPTYWSHRPAEWYHARLELASLLQREISP